MALILEDGSGVTGANAYADRTFADAYFSDRGHAAWTGTDDEKDIALIKATDYIQQRFQGGWLGDKVNHSYPLCWPRQNVDDGKGRLRFDYNEIPTELKKATAEYALRALTTELITDPTTNGLEVVEESKEVGPIKTKKKYSQMGRSKSSLVRDSIFKEYPTADMHIESLLRPASVRQLVRV